MNLRDRATRVVVLRVLRDAVEAEYRAERRAVLDGLRAARAELALKSMRVTLPDDIPIATLTLIDPQPTVVVADEDAFTAWVAVNHPGEVETLVRVRPPGGGVSAARLLRPGRRPAHRRGDPRTGGGAGLRTAFVQPAARARRSGTGRPCLAHRRDRPAPAARPRRWRDVMTTATARSGRDLPATLWFLISQAGHLGCGRWSLESDGRLRCACGTVLYLYRQAADGREAGYRRPPGRDPAEGRNR
ncbi:hypothetical protein ACR6C2_43465 [Streptomyces sp. INA 01156]